MPEYDPAVAVSPGPRPRQLLANPRAERELRHAIKYALVGILNVSIDFALYALMVSTGIWYVAAKVLSLSAATFNGYTLNRIWTFRAGRHRHMTLARYVTVQGGCLALNIAALAVLVEGFGRNEITAQATALPVVAAISFLAQRLWTFSEARR